jgi:MFS family permease
MIQEASENVSTAAPAQASPVIAEPVEPGTSATYLGGRPLRGYLLWFVFATLAINAVWISMGSILLPNQVQGLEFARFFTGADAGVDLTALTNLQSAVAAGTAVATSDQQRQLGLLSQFDASRAQALSLISSLGILGGMLAGPLVGVASDRTRSRFGRRAPWILVGAIAGACFVAGMRFAPSIGVLALLYALTMAVLAVAASPLGVTVADRIPESKLGMTSALGGLGTLLGGIIGTIVAGVTFASLGLNFYFFIAVLLVLGMVGFVVFVKDRPSTALQVEAHGWSAFLRGFLVPLQDADFRWVWIARVILIFGQTVSGALGFFMLQSYIRPALSAAEATQMVPLLGLAGLPGMLAAIVISGRWSDKLGRRKPFVIGASLLMAVSFLVPLFWPSLPAMFIQTVLASIAFGVYIPVDQALFIDVLPDKNAAGRDLGIASMATNIGQVIGPIIAGQVVALTSGYAGVWVVATVLVLIAAGAIVPVKRAR